MNVTIVLICTSLLVPCLYVIVWLKKILRIRHYVKKLPSAKEHPLFGHFYLLLGTHTFFWNTTRKLCNKYYPVFAFNTFTYFNVNLVSPDDIEVILNSKKHIKKTVIYKALECWLGTGLLTSTGRKWHTRRKIITPAFHFNILKHYIPIFKEQTDILADDMWKSSEEGTKAINLSQLVENFALQTISETSMGTSLNESTQRVLDYKKAVHGIGHILVYRVIKPWFSYSWLYVFTPLRYREQKLVRFLHAFSNRIIQQREKVFIMEMKIAAKEKIKQNKPQDDSDDGLKSNEKEENCIYYRNRQSMLDILISAKYSGERISNNGIREEVDTFMFEGHDTISQAITFILMLIANHQEVQDRLVEEINTLRDPLHPTPSNQDLQQLDYMERVIKESLRLYPSVPYMSRTIGEDIYLPSGYFVAEGTMVHIHVYDVHRHPNHYPDPEKFDPDRFLPENVQKRHPYAYIPFSAGPRNCIGQKYAMNEMKTCIWGLLSKFELIPVTIPESLTFFTDLVIRTHEPITIKVKPRK